MQHVWPQLYSMYNILCIIVFSRKYIGVGVSGVGGGGGGGGGGSCFQFRHLI